MNASELIQYVIDGRFQEGIRRKSLTAASSLPSLAQKMGHRKAARTRERRQYTEGFGGVYHHYFHDARRKLNS